MVARGIGILVFGAVMLLACLFTGASAGDWQTETARQLEQQLQSPLVGDTPSCPDRHFDSYRAVVRFYATRDYEPAWVDQFGLLPEGAMALAVVKQAGNQGLRYADYRNPWLDDLLDGVTTRPVIIGPTFNGKQVQLDLAVTEMVLRYAWHRTMGRIDPMMIYGVTTEKEPVRDLAVALAESLESGRLDVFFAQLGPQHTAYRALQKSLSRYQRIKTAGGWSAIDDGPPLEHGECGVRVAQLRNRLGVSGDVHDASELKTACFDDRLATAVAEFQRRHGLNADGVVGERTLAALNVPVEQRIRQIQLNLERWRWMPEDLGSRYVLVNIPGFQMQVIEAGQVVKTMRTIVGQKRRPTPVLSSKITYLEINPYWYVPPKIAREDLLPKIQENPSYLVRQNFRVFDSWDKDARELNPFTINWASLSEDHFPFRLRQEPSAHNALGRVKFMFPNELSVYIHDTPSKNLFKRSSRPFSSGCVRVEAPLELVTLLLRHQNWDQARLAEAVASNQRQVVILDDPMPVHLVYLTAWVDAGGETHFGKDIYGHDQTLLSALNESTATPRGPLMVSVANQTKLF
ncbi:MAG: L,D-transpeptidase family protein [Deltaproteobacteria bacterium]|nr:L,D-transpeptidase family protein [Deltaproteobacteria bacterium]